MSRSLSFARSLAIVAAAALFAACADETPVAPPPKSSFPAQLAKLQGTDKDGVIATLQQVTARYHDLDVAKNEGFVLLHPCENRPGEGPVGIVYVHPGRLMDGVIDPNAPDALIYEPAKKEEGRPKLVGAEFAIPYGLWTEQSLPTFLGATFQNEEEFGVYALHAWIWRSNPNGLFAETNPRVSCGDE
jgi:hypothetical protein